ncbi:hypothetical protein Tco_1471663 [Tanacetum coccineum]
MKKIIKEEVKIQVKEQVSKILLKIEKFVSDQLEAEVLNHSSNEAKTSHVVATNLFELELKKILIDKMENNKSIGKSIQQKTLYKALIDAYETDKDILETYGDTIIFKRHIDDEDEDEEPFVGSNRGSKRRRAGKEPESTSAPKEKTSKSSGKSKEGSKSHHTSTSKSAQAEEPIHADEDLEEPTHYEFDTGFTEDKPVDETTQHPDCTLARNEDPRESFNEQMDTPLDFSAFMLNRLKVDTLTPELLADLTYELMKGSCKSLVELEYFLQEVCKATTDQLDWNNLEGQQYPHDLHKPLPLIPNSCGLRVIPFDHFINNDHAYLSGGVSSQTYATSVTKTKDADYGYIKWIEDFVPNSMCLTRSIVLRRRVEDLQLGVESYQKKLNLTRPNTYRSDLKRKTPYTAYSNPKGFIYQNKDKKNILMRIDELYKFSDVTLNDVLSALNDILKKIWMEYLP